jgi:glutamine synthetase
MTIPLRPEALREEGFDTVVVTSADVTGRLVGKRFPPEEFLRRIEDGVTLSSCVLGWDLDQWPGPVQAYTGHHTGWHDVRLVPDLSTLRPAAWLDRTAICIADFFELGRDEPVEVAPRTILRRQVGRFESDGLTPRVASELEFHLYEGSTRDGFESITPTTRARADYTVQAGDGFEPFFSRVRGAVDDSGLGLGMSQAEWGLGQWEINLRHGEALDMADRHVLFKLALRDMARQHEMTVTFMAKPFGDTTGSSAHLHLSVLDMEGRNAFFEEAAEHGMSAALLAAVGGLLRHGPELMLWYAPTVNSYRRTGSGEFSGNGLSWGIDSRMVSCRVLPEGAADTRLEWRVPGADVNPYLAIAALLASVRDGIATGADPGEPLIGEGWERPVTPLPTTLGEAVEAFTGSAFAQEAFGKEVARHYAVAGAWEWERFFAADAVTEWERRRYLDVI